MNIQRQMFSCWWLAASFISLFACITPLSAQTEYLRYLDTTRNLKVGDSERQVETTLQRFDTESWSSLTNLYPRRLQFLAGQRVLAWLTHPKRQVGEGYILAVFSADGKLSDLLRFEPQLRIFPLVRGPHAQRLASIKKGMSIDDMYRHIGEVAPVRLLSRRGRQMDCSLFVSGGRTRFLGFMRQRPRQARY